MNKVVTTDVHTDNQWQKMVMKYNRPELRKSIWQIFNTLVPYILMWFVMFKSLEYPYWVTLLLSIPAAGLLIRLFIIFHDCGHGSFFKTRRTNRIVGGFLGILTFTPYYKWHNQHSVHHATNGNLDKRGTGDVWTMTLEEYRNSTPKKRFFYRVFRHPFVLFIIGSVMMVFVFNRLTRKGFTREEKNDIYLTNTAIVVMAVLISLLIGFKAYLLIQLPILLISHTLGIWLFYVQHQFEDAHWERNENWDYKTAAIKGSSFLKLDPVLQWFTGNIGFHHVHHLSSRIPNYNLPKCHKENEIFKNVKPIRLFETFRLMRLALWDEANRKLVRF
jgi:acyl-lipid omega-6 desaturase (Delta-12 desaturase)